MKSFNMMRHLLSLTILLTIFSALPVQAEEEKFYGPVLDLNGRLGSNRNIGRVELAVPIQQTKDKLLFADIRTVLTDQNEREGNLGIAYRQVLNFDGQDYIAGGFGALDRRRSEFGNYFSQVTVGGEVLGDKWRGRANYYHPTSDAKTITDAPDTAAFTADGFVLVNPNKVVEIPLKGLDFEVGRRLPLFKEKETWAHVGAYKFGFGDNVNLNGVRFRGETQVNKWLRLGVESSYDNIRKDNHYFDVRVRIPLQKNLSKKQSRPISTIHRYMQEPIVRDVDIVATNSSLSTALAMSGGKPEKYFFVDNSAGGGGNGTPDNPYNNLAAAEAAVKKDNTIIVRLGDGATTNQNAGITISDSNVRLLGTGIDLSTRDGVLIESATTAPQITNTAGDAITIAAQDTEVAGFNIVSPSADGVFVLNIDNANIHDNIISGAGNNGINTAFTANVNRSVTIRDNVISGSTLRGITLRSFNGADVTAVVSGNTSTGNTQEAIRYEVGATNSTLDVTSTSNTADTSGGVAGFYTVSSGNGDLTLNSSGDTANNNTANGFFTLLGGTGTHNVTMSNTTGNSNGQIGIGVDVQDSTNVTADLSNTTSTGNTTDGLNIISRSDTVLNATVTNHTSTGNTQQGVDITADGTTTVMNIDLDNVNASTSGSSGMFLRSRSAGTINATLVNSTMDNNTNAALFVGAATTSNTSVQVDESDFTNSSTFNLQLTNTSSGTYNVDFGGGGLGSAGQNRIFNSGNEDVFGNLNGSAVSAQLNWWGVATGLAGGEQNLISGGSVDATIPLVVDPRP